MTRHSLRRLAARRWHWIFGLAATMAGCMLAERPRYYDAETPPIPAAAAADLVARGRAVASVLCAHCHADPATGAFSGRRLDEIPTVLARSAYASNLTADPVYGIGSYSDAELVTFMRTGGQARRLPRLPVGTPFSLALGRRRSRSHCLPAFRRPGRPASLTPRPSDPARVSWRTAGQVCRKASTDAGPSGRRPRSGRPGGLWPVRGLGQSSVLRLPLRQFRQA